MCQRAKKVVSDSPGLVDFTIRLVNSVLNLPNGQVKYFEEFNLQKNCEINEWFSSNVRLSYTHRIMGLPGGKHCKSLQRNVWLGAVSTLKVVSLDRVCRILPWLLWEADVTNVGALKVFVRSMLWNLSINTPCIRLTHCRLWNLLNGLEIYSTNLGINEQGMRTHLSLSSCPYMCPYLERV